MNKLSLGCNIVLSIFLVALALGLAQTTNRVDMLEKRVDYEVGKIADDFLQEDDFHPYVDKVYEHLKDMRQRLEYLEAH